MEHYFPSGKTVKTKNMNTVLYGIPIFTSAKTLLKQIDKKLEKVDCMPLEDHLKTTG